jgi:carbon-monoxide dehydrogenase medium subunit
MMAMAGSPGVFPGRPRFLKRGRGNRSGARMRFEYLEPESMDEALGMLGRYREKAKIIAGGTDLMLQMRLGAKKPQYVIDITRIPALDAIAFDEGRGLRLGALTTIRALETSAELRERFPILVQAAGQLGSAPIRNVATVGGNLCNALPSAETSQALVALCANVRIIGPEGERTLPIESFFTGVGKTAIRPDELLAEILVPRMAPGTSGVYIKHAPRGPIDLAIVNITVLMTMEPGQSICRDARIVLGAVAPTPLRARKAEDLLKGHRIDSALIRQAAQTASDEAHPRRGSIRGSLEYKKEMVRVLTARAIGQIAGS